MGLQADLDGNNAAEFSKGSDIKSCIGISDGRLSNNILDGLFSDQRKTIGVAACDVDGDGMKRSIF